MSAVPSQFDSSRRRGSPARFGPDNVLRGLKASKTGEVISLNLPLDDPNPPFGRGPFRRHVRLHNQVRPLDGTRMVLINDDEISIALQGSSQWDSLAHFGVIQPGTSGVYFDGVPLSETYPQNYAPNLGIDAFGPGFVARGVLADVVGWAGEGREFLEGDYRIDRNKLERCLADQGSVVEPGDILLIYTGFQKRRALLGGVYPPDTAGLDASTVDLLVGMNLLALASDNPAIEATPTDYAIHIGLLVGEGLPLGELWALDELAAACRQDGRYDFLLVSVPLNVPGAFGSTANAIAIR